mgnify:CR=1 FL=1
MRSTMTDTTRLNPAKVLDPAPATVCAPRSDPSVVHASDAGTAVDPEVEPFMSSLAHLLSRHVLRDGELVLLVLKPSRWFILFQTLRFAAIVGICLSGLMLTKGIPSGRGLITYIEVAILLITARLMFAALQWVARLYVLTDLRILKLSGVFTPEVFDCPLRKVARTRLVYTFRERLWRLGSIEIIPREESLPFEVWNTVRRPQRVHEQIVAAINRARTGGMGE